MNAEDRTSSVETKQIGSMAVGNLKHHRAPNKLKEHKRCQINEVVRVPIENTRTTHDSVRLGSLHLSISVFNSCSHFFPHCSHSHGCLMFVS